MTPLENLQLAYWNLYYEAYGLRPRHVDFTSWDEDTYEAGIELCLAYIRQAEGVASPARGLERPTSHE